MTKFLVYQEKGKNTLNLSCSKLHLPDDSFALNEINKIYYYIM